MNRSKIIYTIGILVAYYHQLYSSTPFSQSVKKTILEPITTQVQVFLQEDDPLLEVQLHQDSLYTYPDPKTNLPTSFLKNDSLGCAVSVYHRESQQAHIRKIHIFETMNEHKGYGSYLCKKIVAELCTHFLCKKILLTPYPFLDFLNESAHTRLIHFYTKLGAVLTEKNGMLKNQMEFPIVRAVALKELLPIFEPHPIKPELTKHNICTTIVQYIHPDGQ